MEKTFTETMNNVFKNFFKIWILYFLISATIFFIKNGGDKLMFSLAMFPVFFFAAIFEIVVFS